MVDEEILNAIKAYVDYEDTDGYDFKEISEDLYDERRWTITKEYVILEKNSNKYYTYCYEYDACESCEGSGSGFLEDTVEEVVPIEKIITVYEPLRLHAKLTGEE